ncbi:MAG: D-glycero-beta-D-manno-heptose 1-phosphate adenylyltransferase [Candidatus Omnitrophota bacterium]
MLYKNITSLTSLKKELKKKAYKNKKIVFTNGCFDILHVGHISYLQKAKSLGDILIVGLNSDDSVKRLKGPSRPIVKASDRGNVLLALKSVDLVVVFDELTPIKLIENIRPDVLVKGGDWKIKDIVGSDIVRTYKGKVKSLPFIKGFSTKDIIKKIRNS